MNAIPSGGLAVMQGRRDPTDSLDFFPTPPWAARALIECVLAPLGIFQGRQAFVWEPACGAGHISKTIGDYAYAVRSSDVHDYGIGAEVGSFVGEGIDVVQAAGKPDWIITNPPFNLAEPFLERALREAPGVALLVRTSWLEGGERFRQIFSPDKTPPSVIAQFSERVPMVKGRWDPDASTATSYAWVIWHTDIAPTRFMWIPPGQRSWLTMPVDHERFATSESA